MYDNHYHGLSMYGHKLMGSRYMPLVVMDSGSIVAIFTSLKQC